VPQPYKSLTPFCFVHPGQSLNFCVCHMVVYICASSAKCASSINMCKQCITHAPTHPRNCWRHRHAQQAYLTHKGACIGDDDLGNDEERAVSSGHTQPHVILEPMEPQRLHTLRASTCTTHTEGGVDEGLCVKEERLSSRRLACRVHAAKATL
jgi:hypothetical protein